LTVCGSMPCILRCRSGPVAGIRRMLESDDRMPERLSNGRPIGA
jgi:hypothetical protein